MSRRLRAVVRREYLERVRSKTFIIATVLGPVLMGAMMVFPAVMARQGGGTLEVAVVDRTGQLQEPVEEALRQIADEEGRRRFEVAPEEGGPGETLDAREARLKEAVSEARIDGVLLLPEDALTEARASYFGRTVSNRIELNRLERTVSDVMVSRRLAEADLDVERVRDLTRHLALRTVKLTEKGEREDHGVQIIFAIILLMILYVSILMWGQGAVMTSIIEEKGSRVIEVVASAVPATQLLAGKLIGVGAVGVTQYLVWALCLLVLSLASAGPTMGGLPMPDISPFVLASFVAFFVLGFALYAAFYAAVGAAVNTVQEAQNFVFPIIIPLVMGLMCFPVIIEAPDSTLSTVLSLVPLLTPLLMFLRIVVLTPPTWQIVLSLVLMGLSIYGALWLAARIYRVGILMYGKRPTFPELMRWVRYS